MTVILRLDFQYGERYLYYSVVSSFNNLINIINREYSFVMNRQSKWKPSYFNVEISNSNTNEYLTFTQKCRVEGGFSLRTVFEF